MKRRAILIVLDGVGIGAAPDAALYGDEGSNSLVNTAAALNGLQLPNLSRLGLGHLADIKGVEAQPTPIGAFGVMEPASQGKDSTTGHWELRGVLLKQPFPTYEQGFPEEIIKTFEERIGRKCLGNVVASGTEIIEQLGSDHMKTGCPIVYTSADSVFQIAAHEEVVPLDELYAMCETARELLKGEHAVGRVIARPFTGQAGDFKRTSNRHDYSLAPPRNILDFIIESGQKVIGIGKIKDLFGGRGVSDNRPTTGNEHGIELLLSAIGDGEGSLIFANLLDFDQVYGHRNNVLGYAEALTRFDKALGEILALMHSEDLLFITADHGNDPTTPSTDHSRECVPLLVYGPAFPGNVNLGRRRGFSDVGQTIAEHLGIPVEGLAGQSFYAELRGAS
jgi:phosphopentomutase